MHWKLVLEEYGPKLKYIAGETNVVADARSHLNMHDIEPKQELNYLAECFGQDKEDLPKMHFP